jgi:hypothetical protein
MTPPDPFEAELHALQPRRPSPDLRRRIAWRLAAPRWHSRAALAGGLIAAGVALAVVLDRGGRRVTTEVAPPVATGGAATPTVHEYRLALAKSPEALDALLDAEMRRPASPTRAVAAFAALDAELLSWRGTR